MYRSHLSFRDKPQAKRHGVEEEDGGTGAEEVVSFIDLQPNNLTKPEKGILKKHGYGIVMPDSCNTTRVGAIIHDILWRVVEESSNLLFGILKNSKVN